MLFAAAASRAAGLRRLRDVGAGWLAEAQPVLEQEFVTDDQLGLLEGLIASGQRLGLALEQVDILRANVEVGRRMGGARARAGSGGKSGGGLLAGTQAGVRVA